MKYLFSIYFLLVAFGLAQAQNLLNNGDFESGGNGVGFNINSSFYNAISPPFSGTTSPGNYAVTTNPQPMNTNFFISGGDHTSGSGNMLVVDATNTGGSQRFWRAGNNGEGICSLTIGVTYTFSYWIKSVSIQVTNVSTRADIGFQFNNASNITLIAGAALAPLPSAGWQRVVYSFTPTNNCVNFELWNNNTNTIGNDFAVDDFELIGPPQPLTLTYSAVSPSCPGGNDGYIVGYGDGGNTPYQYFLSGEATANNSTGIFTGLTAGTYSLRILEAADGEITINNIIIADPQDIVVSSPTTICVGGNTNLSVSGSASGYTWTASPPDSSLTNANSANITISPTQTTTYTVTSTSSSSKNLIFNGNFNAGNIGFLTNYVFYSPNNPTGIQRAYGITTNANAWQSGFSPCADHTTGTGNMMVIDGSIVNGGNDKVWCQKVAVTPGQNYTFSYWIQTVATPSPADIDVVINGVVIGSAFAPSNTCAWVQRSYTWNSGTNTIAEICLFDRETTLLGNDFALDDISFVGPTTVCNLSKSVVVTVSTPTIPSFEPVAAICAGANLAPLPQISVENISGTWSPPINNQQTTTYTFTPAPNQCAATTALNIVVNGASITPVFSFNPVETYCVGAPIDAPLPVISSNGITGNWNQIGINTQVLGESTYVFTPNDNQCATSYDLTVNIVDNILPIFTQVNAICAGDSLAPLPTLSNNSIAGSWSPAINNQQTTTYTFTPSSNSCAAATTMEIVVNTNVLPQFEFGSDITACFRPPTEAPPAPLPTKSTNGIEGFWSPTAINYGILGTSTYTFTPINTLCAREFVLTVNIVELPDFVVSSGCIGENFTLSVALEKSDENAIINWYNDQNEIIGSGSDLIITKAGTFKVVKTLDDCFKEQTISVASVYCKIPKGISPNNDSLNEYFDLSNLNVKHLRIFNRYGTEVYSQANYKKEWDGRTNNGNELPDGTYYYVIDFNYGKSKTGWVYISK